MGAVNPGNVISLKEQQREEMDQYSFLLSDYAGLFLLGCYLNNCWTHVKSTSFL